MRALRIRQAWRGVPGGGGSQAVRAWEGCGGDGDNRPRGEWAQEPSQPRLSASSHPRILASSHPRILASSNTALRVSNARRPSC
eukprot:751317-Rhodomonas_salina.2